jgi:hypothetical protein
MSRPCGRVAAVSGSGLSFTLCSFQRLVGADLAKHGERGHADLGVVGRGDRNQGVFGLAAHLGQAIGGKLSQAVVPQARRQGGGGAGILQFNQGLHRFPLVAGVAFIQHLQQDRHAVLSAPFHQTFNRFLLFTKGGCLSSSRPTARRPAISRPGGRRPRRL